MVAGQVYLKLPFDSPAFPIGTVAFQRTPAAARGAPKDPTFKLKEVTKLFLPRTSTDFLQEGPLGMCSHSYTQDRYPGRREQQTHGHPGFPLLFYVFLVLLHL